MDGGNTSFANINASKPVWWININPSKFKSDLHLLLAKEVPYCRGGCYSPTGQIVVENPGSCADMEYIRGDSIANRSRDLEG